MSSPIVPPSALDERYGRTPRTANRTRAIFIATAAAFVVVFAAWLVWGGLLGAPAQLQVQDTGYTIVDEQLVEVRFSVTAEPNTPISCAVQALNSSFGIIGWRLVDLPVTEQRTRSFSEEVRTTEQAVTGLVYRCWLT
ncbi:MAG: DUF4307 domain-containing protein [Microbacteriaceae bacterium]